MKKVSRSGSPRTIRERFVNWIAKIRQLNKWINELEKLSSIPIIAIAVFLLKCQVIEFELKSLITRLDLHLSQRNKSGVLEKKIRTPKDFDGFTLGELVREFSQFKGIGDSGLIEDVRSQLGKLLGMRNEFTHNLFSSEKDLRKLNSEVRGGILIANGVLDQFKQLEDSLGRV